ncbi:hypothetical protein BT63DRAFT_56661 [Microthyrium microscopicum]|uniref:CFEM domain-containing protein n=1 Tax=Microthyrium microscopicum TaxID=703497 RepID=A0A6A6U435_9PEZI|nr:hypothetical protein BT63DRAFT_56661 [Microthyrium microscopicum]
MKTSILLLTTLITSILATASPQAPAIPQQFSFPRCGMNTMISGIAQSGCSATDGGCLCKQKSFIKAGSEGIPKKCPAEADQKQYIDFINMVCSGQPGYPLAVKAASKNVGTRLGGEGGYVLGMALVVAAVGGML